MDAKQIQGSLEETAEQSSLNVRNSLSDGDTLTGSFESATSHGSSPQDNDRENVLKPSAKEVGN